MQNCFQMCFVLNSVHADGISRCSLDTWNSFENILVWDFSIQPFCTFSAPPNCFLKHHFAKIFAVCCPPVSWWSHHELQHLLSQLFLIWFAHNPKRSLATLTRAAWKHFYLLSSVSLLCLSMDNTILSPENAFGLSHFCISEFWCWSKKRFVIKTMPPSTSPMSFFVLQEKLTAVACVYLSRVLGRNQTSTNVLKTCSGFSTKT